MEGRRVSGQSCLRTFSCLNHQAKLIIETGRERQESLQKNNVQNRKPRLQVPIIPGNLLQLAGLVLGFLLVSSVLHPPQLNTLTMVIGYLMVYFNSHSISHYAVGRLAGIRFARYSLGGSAHASAYPPVMRQLFERLPFFSVHAQADSMKAAPSAARGLMFLAGVISTVVLSTFATLCAYNLQIRGAMFLAGFNIFWQIGTIITESRSGGDIAKAIQAFRS